MMSLPLSPLHARQHHNSSSTNSSSSTLSWLLLVSCLLLLMPSCALSRPISVILDTDIGDDFDDMFALTFLMSRPDLFSVEAIVVSSFNTTKRALITAYSLASFYPHLSDLRHLPPIVMGLSGADTSSMYQLPFVPSNFTLNHYTQVLHGRLIEDGLQHLAQLLSNWDLAKNGPLHVIEIAPASTLGALVVRLPAADLGKIRVFAMSGSIYKGYNGLSPAQEEYNVQVNISASAAVYAHANQYYRSDGGAGLVQAPLDTTVYQQWTGKLWQPFLLFNNSKSPFVFTVMQAYEAWYAHGGKNFSPPLKFGPDVGTSIMYDPQAAWSALYSMPRQRDCAFYDARLVYQCLTVSVNATGFTVIDAARGTNVSVAIALNATDPYAATTEIGRDILSSIANATLLSDALDVDVTAV